MCVAQKVRPVRIEPSSSVSFFVCVGTKGGIGQESESGYYAVSEVVAQ